MKKSIFTILIATLVSIAGFSQHDFKFHVSGISDTTVYLANYYGGKMYYNDTTRADANGLVEFKGVETKPGGIYAVVFPDNKTYFEVVVNEPIIEMSTSYSNPIKNMKVIVSKENTAFYGYMKFVSETQAKLGKLTEEKKVAKSDKEEEKISDEIQLIREDADRFKSKYLTDNKDLFAAKVLRTSDEIKVPEFKDDEGNMDDKKRYKYYHDHYLDNVDLMDDRLLRTPVLNQKITTYIEKITPQIPDSICAAINYLTSKTSDTSLIYKYIIQYSTNTYQNSDIMGMDAVFICIAEDYYSQGKAFWLDEEKTKEIVDMYNVRKNLIVGATADNIKLMDIDSNWQALYDVKSKYTVLVFWTPTCGHCKKEIPKLHDFYKVWKPKGVEVYSVVTEFENDKWPEFVKEHGLDWINVSDNPEINKNAYKYIAEGKTTLTSLNYRDYWDIFSTPHYYLLDENKVIIAKKIGPDQLPDFIEKHELRQKKIEEDKANSKTN